MSPSSTPSTWLLVPEKSPPVVAAAVAELVQALAPGQALDDGAVRALAQALKRQSQTVARYRCSDCGFAASAFFWQCPGCKSWDTLKPLGPGEQGGALAPLGG